jgi:hypothetical protein
MQNALSEPQSASDVAESLLQAANPNNARLNAAAIAARRFNMCLLSKFLAELLASFH